MKLEEFAVFLFELCQDRQKTNNQVIEDITTKIGRFPSQDIEPIVRNYKTTGSGLEEAAKNILSAFGEVVVVESNEPAKQFNESIDWKAPSTCQSTWSDKDRIYLLVEQWTGGDDVFVNCLEQDEHGTYYYEDSQHSTQIDVWSEGDVYERAMECLTQYCWECSYEVARYGLTGLDDMDTDGIVQTAFGDINWVELNDGSIAVIDY